MPKKPDKKDSAINELTIDLQRVRADFENYRKNVDIQKVQARQIGEEMMIQKLLPIIDNINRAISHTPADLTDNEWVRGVINIGKTIDNLMSEFGLTKINATPGAKFDPNLHDAVQFDESTDGENEIIDTELQTGYLLNGVPIRHSMVRVKRQ